MTHRALITALAALLFTAAPIPAQQPAATAPPTPPERWRAVFDLLFSGSAGNQDLLVFTTGARLTHLEKERFEMELSAQARYGHSEGREVARSLRGGWKLDVNPQDRWSPFVFGTLEHDPFRRLNVRANGGGGVRYAIVDRPDAHLSLSAAALYSYEDIDVRLDSAVDQFRQTARQSWRLKVGRGLPSNVRMEQVTFYQPRFAAPGDYLLTAESSLRARLNTRLSLKLMHAYERNSAPPEDVRPDDHRFEAGLSVQF
jgi:hypothetical protein